MKAGRSEGSYDEDPELTLARLDAEFAGELLSLWGRSQQEGGKFVFIMWVGQLLFNNPGCCRLI